MENGNPNYLKVLKAQPLWELDFPSWIHLGLALHQASIHSKTLYPSALSLQQGCFTFQKVMRCCTIHGFERQTSCCHEPGRGLGSLSDITKIFVSIKWNTQILSFLENSIILIIRKSWWSECSFEQDLYDVIQWHAWATTSGLCLCLSAGSQLEKGHLLRPSLVQSWMAWLEKCQPEPSPGELGFLWKKAKYGSVPAASRTVHDMCSRSQCSE